MLMLGAASADCEVRLLLLSWLYITSAPQSQVEPRFVLVLLATAVLLKLKSEVRRLILPSLDSI